MAVERRVGATSAELLESDPVLRRCTEVMPGWLQPWQFIPPLVYAEETMTLLGMDSIRLVGSTLARGVLMDERWWVRPGGGAAVDERR